MFKFYLDNFSLLLCFFIYFSCKEGISSKIRLRVGERPRKCYCLPECSDIHYEHYIDKKWAPKM